MRNKQRRAANEARRQLAAERQKPLPLAKQQERAAERAAAHAFRYPLAPAYHTHVGTHDGPPTPRGVVVPKLLPAYRMVWAVKTLIASMVRQP